MKIAPIGKLPTELLVEIFAIAVEAGMFFVGSLFSDQ